MSSSVCVTGLGAVSAFGTDVDSLWRGCLAGDSVVQPIPAMWQHYADYRSGIWLPLPAIDFRQQGFSRNEILQRDPVSLLALMAAQEALIQANLDTTLENTRQAQYQIAGIQSEQAGVFMGTGIGGAHTFLQNHAEQILARTKPELLDSADVTAQQVLALLRHPGKSNRMAVPMLMPNAVSASIGIKYGLHGHNRTLTHACAAGTSAIGEAWRAIHQGSLDFALCGGAEYLLDDYGTIYRGFDMLGTLVKPGDNPQQANCPFDQARSGFLFAQGGAGVLVLESEQHAQQRGAKVLARITGYAETFDASSMVALADDGVQISRAMQQALHQANLSTADIDYINAHATGTQANDRVEARVIQALFPQQPWVASTKSILGHTIGASGALEAIITVLSLHHQQTPACINLHQPAFELNFVKDSQQSIQLNRALSSSYAFGGHNAALIMERGDA